MPTNRTKRTRKFKPSTISGAMLHFLQTGNYRLRELFPDDHRGRVEVFRLAYPSEAMRERLRAVWETHREEVLRTWKGPGRPWAESFFNE